MCVHIHWLLPLAGFTLRGWYLLTSSLHHVQWKRWSFPYNLIPLSMWMNKCDFIYISITSYRSSLKILLPMQTDLLYCRVVFFSSFFVFFVFISIHLPFLSKTHLTFFSFCFVSKTFSFFSGFCFEFRALNSVHETLWRDKWELIHTESGKLVVCERATRDFN